MNKTIVSLVLELKNFMPADCPCKIENLIKKKIPVIDIAINPVTQILTVTYNKDKVSADKIKQALLDCGYRCESPMPPAEEMHHMHEAMKKGMPHEDHHAHMEADMKRRFFISLVVSIPVLLLSPTIQNWFGFTIPQFTGANFILLVLATIIVIYGGLTFYRGALRSLKNKILDMNVLVSIAVIAGYLFSVGSTFFFVSVDFYWEISTLVVFLLFGHWMEMKAVRGASGALKELIKLIPPTANLVMDGEITEVPTAELNINDLVLVRPGEKIPIDGVVEEGTTTVNEAMITGESKPISKIEGDAVIGGTINSEGALRVRVTKTGEETALAQIIQLVKQAQTSKPKTQKLADRAANYLTLIAIIVGASTFLFWWGLIGVEIVFALTLTITVIVITCPHALGLAIPTVTSISTTIGAQKGILIRDANATEQARNLQAVIFDKTGTLTKGEFGVTDIITTDDWTAEEILRKAAALEENSEHVIAKGIVAKAKEVNAQRSDAKNFESIPGKGAKAQIEREDVYIGNANLMRELNISVDQFEKGVTKLSSQGKTVVYMATKAGLKGFIALADLIREESREAVKALKELGLEVAMLTGDNKQTAEYVASELELDTFFAEVLPEQKAETVKKLQQQGKTVGMVGDGVNDAPALVQAEVGIAIGAGTDVAIESADVVLVKNDPRDVVKLIKLSKLTMKKMKENLAWATGYNAVAIPAAAGLFIPLGIVLRPEWAALIMAASSIIVVVNALLLRKEKL
ncbi:MAG: heavy metal translocating P-type ATPase [Promethearchaeota archaeon]